MRPMTFALAAAAMLAVFAGSAAAQSFEGRKKCSSCHKSQAQSWSETAHAKAMDSLKPNTKAEAKKKAKLDPKKDYTKDKDCVGCHVDGWDAPCMAWELATDQLPAAGAEPVAGAASAAALSPGMR